MYYLFDFIGFELGVFACLEDAIAEMENLVSLPSFSSTEMFITTNPNPWAS